MRAYEIHDGGIDALTLAERPEPTPGPTEVVVAMRASSINYRDLATIRNPAARGIPAGRIPNSDGAGDVVAVGSAVTTVAAGDRVAGTFFQNWIDGPPTAAAMASALGGPIDGVLAEQVVLREDGVVVIPDHLSYAEAATLPCAGVTAWRIIAEVGKLGPGDTVLLLGTGGVSIFALQFARMRGARAIITSSSDAKLERAQQLGAWRTINYRETPDWDDEVLALTDGTGVDLVVEVGGPGTLQKSINAVRLGGRVGYIGILADGSFDPTAVMRKSVCLQGVYVGSRRVFTDMNRAIAQHQMQPVVDAAFGFDEARGAFHAMAAAQHFGKIVVTY